MQDLQQDLQAANLQLAAAKEQCAELWGRMEQQKDMNSAPDDTFITTRSTLQGAAANAEAADISRVRVS